MLGDPRRHPGRLLEGCLGPVLVADEALRLAEGQRHVREVVVGAPAAEVAVGLGLEQLRAAACPVRRRARVCAQLEGEARRQPVEAAELGQRLGDGRLEKQQQGHVDVPLVDRLRVRIAAAAALEVRGRRGPVYGVAAGRLAGRGRQRRVGGPVGQGRRRRVKGVSLLDDLGRVGAAAAAAALPFYVPKNEGLP